MGKSNYVLIGPILSKFFNPFVSNKVSFTSDYFYYLSAHELRMKINEAALYVEFIQGFIEYEVVGVDSQNEIILDGELGYLEVSFEIFKAL